jgi:hypothetical protein
MCPMFLLCSYVCNMFLQYKPGNGSKTGNLLFKSYNLEKNGTYFCFCTLFHCVHTTYSRKTTFRITDYLV